MSCYSHKGLTAFRLLELSRSVCRDRWELFESVIGQRLLMKFGIGEDVLLRQSSVRHVGDSIVFLKGSFTAKLDMSRFKLPVDSSKGEGSHRIRLLPRIVETEKKGGCKSLLALSKISPLGAAEKFERMLASISPLHPVGSKSNYHINRADVALLRLLAVLEMDERGYHLLPLQPAPASAWGDFCILLRDKDEGEYSRNVCPRSGHCH